ncbi:MAG: peroxiredoxin family protein [Burkholderiales bacterium]
MVSSLTTTPRRKGRIAFFIALTLALAVAQAQTQTTKTTARSPATIEKPAAALEKPVMVVGKTLDGQVFDMQALRGKVVLVMLWSSDCAMCRDRMPELRDNYMGWKGKPFEIVAISHDAKRQDLLSYQQVIASSVKSNQRFPWLWAGEFEHKDSLGKPKTMPMSYLIDKKGMVVETHSGRIPPEVWDKIADLVY